MFYEERRGEIAADAVETGLDVALGLVQSAGGALMDGATAAGQRAGEIAGAGLEAVGSVAGAVAEGIGEALGGLGG